MINANAFGSTFGFGALPGFDPSAVANVPAGTPGPSQQPMSAASTYSGLPLRMEVQAGGIINPFTRRGVTARPDSPGDVPRTTPPGGDNVDLDGNGAPPDWMSGEEIMGIPKRTLVIGGVLFAAGLVTLSVLKG